MKIKIINGPNLNLLGSREPDIYGNKSFESFLPELQEHFPDIQIDSFQSNIEGEIVTELQKSDSEGYDGIVLNAAAYTHYSIAILDAIKAIKAAVVEVHISQPAAREDYRKKSVIAEACRGSVSGFGLISYQLAIEGLYNVCK